MPVTGTKLSALADLGIALDGSEHLYMRDSEGNPVKVTLDEIAQYIAVAQSIVPENLPYRGAIVRRTSNLTGLGASNVVTWQEALFDSDSFWSAGAPTRLTVPSGVTKVRLFGGAVFEAGGTAGSVSVYFRRNGGNFAQADDEHHGRNSWRSTTTGFTSNRNAVFSSMIDVSAGDYFEFGADISMSGIDEILADAATFFELQVLEADVSP